MIRISCWAVVILFLLSSVAFSEVTRETIYDSIGRPQGAVYFEAEREIAREKFTRKGKKEGENPEVTLTGNIPDGTVTERYHTGEVEAVWTFKEGKREGPAYTYYNTGEKSGEMNFKNGKLHGVNKKYYRSQAVRREMEYDDGILVQRKEYYESGKPKPAWKPISKKDTMFK